MTLSPRRREGDQALTHRGRAEHLTVADGWSPPPGHTLLPYGGIRDLMGMDAIMDLWSYTEPDTRDITALGYEYV